MKDAYFRLRMSKNELSTLKLNATKAGVTPSEYVRLKAAK